MQLIAQPNQQQQEEKAFAKLTNSKRACDDCKRSHRRCLKNNMNINCHECDRKGIDCKFDILRKQRGRPVVNSNKKNVKTKNGFFF